MKGSRYSVVQISQHDAEFISFVLLEGTSIDSVELVHFEYKIERFAIIYLKEVSDKINPGYTKIKLIEQ